MSKNAQAAFIAACLFFMMLPVTAMVPVLQEITAGRFPDITIFEKHLFMSINMIGAFLFAPLAGLLSDRFQRRKIFITLAFVFNALSLMLMSLDVPFWLFFFLRFLEGCAHITSLSLLMTLGIELSKRGESGKVMGLIGAAISLGVAFGAPLGGAVGQENPIYVFYMGATILVLLSLLSRFLQESAEKSSRPHALKALLASIGGKSRLFIPYIFTFVDRLSVGFIVSTLTLYLRNVLLAEPKEIGLLMSLFLIPFSLLIYPVARLSKKRNLLSPMILGSALYGIVLTSISFVTLSTMAWLMLAAGVVSAIMYAPSLVMVARLAGEENKGTAMAGFNCAGSLGFLLGPLISGSLLQSFEGITTSFSPYQLVFLCVGGLEILCAVAFVKYLSHFKMRVEKDQLG
jgi:MFS family permease